MRVQATQLSLFAGALDIPGVSRVASIVTFDLQQLDFTAQRGKISLLVGVGLAQVTDFVAARIELGIQAVLGQLGHGQPLFQQRHTGLLCTRPALDVPGQRQQWHCCARQTEQNAGQVHSHSDSCR